MMILKFFFIILLSNFSFVFLTPLSKIIKSEQNKTLVNDNEKIDKTWLDKNKTQVFEELGLSNFSINKTENTSRTFQVLSFNSYIVGVVFKYLQSIFGKLIIPDSKIYFLQTFVNPFYPFQYADHLVSEINESRAKKPIEQSSLDKIIDLIKPFYVAGLKELKGFHKLDLVDPFVDYTIDHINEQAFDALLNDKFSYDFIDYNFTKLKLLNNSSTNNSVSINQKILINKTLDKELENNVKKIELENQISNNKSSNINEENLNLLIKPTSLKNQTLYNETKNFEKGTLNTISQALDLNEQDIMDETLDFKNKKKRQVDYNIIDQSELKKILDQNKPLIEIEMLNQKTKIENAKNSFKIKDSDLNRIFINEDQPVVLNKDEYSLDGSFFIDNDTLHDQLAFISIEDCKDLQNCELGNSTSYTNDNKLATNLQNEYENELTNVPQIAQSISFKLVHKPIIYLKERLNEIKEHFKKDFSLIGKMFKSLISITSLTCRYKLVCLASTFLSVHTPDFLKSLIPSSFEEDYFQLIEMANQNEYLNAFLTGFIGFECEDFYSDETCLS